MVIGLLVAVAVGLFALARIVASHTQDLQVLSDAEYSKNVHARIRPPVKEAIAGRDKGTAEGGASGTAVVAAMPQNGTQLFEQTCNVCHGQGIGGAPKAGDKAAWAARIAEGKAMLYEHALKGFQGKAGVMPPKGGRMDAPDDLVKQAVDHMVQMAQ
ncbi:MAG: cytochrome c5 family protein [Gammaproteobacteria bacterium]|nr:MAG: cytochrome c5 family protein [Gammaproteobacteria bacterium]